VRLFILFILYLLYINFGLSQNLVQNHSFETEIIDFKNYSAKWQKCLKSDSPDYFLFDSITKTNNIFDNYIGNVTPRTGNACVGLFFYRKHKNKNTKNVREFIQGKLKEPLKKDSIYYIEYYVWLDLESNIALKDFGAYLSSNKIYYKKDKYIFEIKPQIIYQDDYITDKNNWSKVSGYYKAKGNEKYIIIGCFKPDKKLKRTRLKNDISNKDKQLKWDTENREYIAYYYIDDVNVSIATKIEPENIIIPEESIALINDEPEIDDFNIKHIDIDSVVILKNILFEFDKAEIQPISYNELNRLLNLLRNNPGLKIDIYGHADKIGNEKYNKKLSELRAKAVFEYLIANGINKSRLSFDGFGSSRPIKKNNSEEDRKYNRRVEFKVIEK